MNGDITNYGIHKGCEATQTTGGPQLVTNGSQTCRGDIVASVFLKLPIWRFPFRHDGVPLVIIHFERRDGPVHKIQSAIGLSPWGREIHVLHLCKGGPFCCSCRRLRESQLGFLFPAEVRHQGGPRLHKPEAMWK